MRKKKNKFRLKKTDDGEPPTEVLSQDEIDQLLTAINAGDVEDDEMRPASDSRKIKIYDFKRPDKFQKDHIRFISMVFEVFSRLTTTTLSAQCCSMAHVHVASVDQLTYEEFIRSIPTPTTLAIINPDPLKVNWIIEIDPAVTFAILDLLLGGSGDGMKARHELTDIEASIMESVIIRLLGNVRESWTPVIDLRPRLGQIDTNPQFAQIIPPTDMVVLVTIETKIGDVEGMINVCIPYDSISVLLGKMTMEFLYYNPSFRVKAFSDSMFDDANVTVRAEYFRSTMPLERLESLKKGDEISVDKESSMYRLFVDDEVVGKFKVVDGGKNKVVEITNAIKYTEKNHMKEKHNVDYTTADLGAAKMQISVELGRTLLPLKTVKELGEGSIVELNKLAGEPVDIFVHNVLVAKGEVVVIDENFGVRIVEILDGRSTEN